VNGIGLPAAMSILIWDALASILLPRRAMADGIVITGLSHKIWRPALLDAYKSISKPKIVIGRRRVCNQRGVFAVRTS